MLLKTAVLPGEMNAREIGRVEQDVGDLCGIARHEIDDARRQAGALEEPQDVVAAQHRARRRLPDHRVAHQRGSGRQVAADRGEIEWRNGIDEAFERPVVHAVPHPVGAERLLARTAPGRRYALNRKKSISSDAESISAWNAVFDWPSIVAALSVCRHVVVSNSAARKKIAIRSRCRRYDNNITYCSVFVVRDPVRGEQRAIRHQFARRNTLSRPSCQPP